MALSSPPAAAADNATGAATDAGLTPADLPLLAQRLQAWAACVEALDTHVHPDWWARAGGSLPPAALFARPWPPGPGGGEAARAGAGGLHARRRVHLGLARALCAGEPGPAELLAPLARWCLLPAAALHQRLLTLALARRPGVLRCCVHRPVRAALWAALGPAAEALSDGRGAPGLALTAAANAPPRAQLTWLPAQWAGVGYGDLVRARLWPGRCLRRWARLSLPAALPRAPQAPARPPAAAQRGPALAPWIDEVDAWLA